MNEDFSFNDLPLGIIQNKEFGYFEVDRKNIHEEEVDKFYEQEFYELERDDYIKRAWGEDYPYYEVQWMLRIHEIKNLLYRKDIYGLDIGTGPGTFLKVCKENNIEALGIDISPAAIKFIQSKGLRAELGVVGSDDQFNENIFDFIHCSEVLEHLLDPIGMLSRAAELLKKDGIICISVPNDFSLIQYLANSIVTDNKRYWWVNQKHHLNYFSMNSIKLLLDRAGFEDTYFMNTFPLDNFILMGKNYVNDPSQGPECHSMRVGFEQSILNNLGKEHGLKELSKVYKSHSELGYGRHIVAFSRKK